MCIQPIEIMCSTETKRKTNSIGVTSYRTEIIVFFYRKPEHTTVATWSACNITLIKTILSILTTPHTF